eukprot:5184439-Ditylum_brightwellii.AAC.1
MACQSHVALDAAFAIASITKQARCLALALAVRGGGTCFKLPFLVAALNVQRTKFVKGSFSFFCFFLALLRAAVTLAFTK